MSHSELNRIAGLRKEFAVSQNHLAELLGQAGRSAISRYELGKSPPPLTTVMALLVVFDTSLSKLFPQTYDRIEQEVAARVKIASVRIEDDSGAMADKHRALYASIARRADETIGV